MQFKWDAILWNLTSYNKGVKYEWLIFLGGCTLKISLSLFFLFLSVSLCFSLFLSLSLSFSLFLSLSLFLYLSLFSLFAYLFRSGKKTGKFKCIPIKPIHLISYIKLRVVSWREYIIGFFHLPNLPFGLNVHRFIFSPASQCWTLIQKCDLCIH
jgi:hypothetical protein